MDRIRKRLTYANVMSTVAAFLALGGATAFAAGTLGANSVGTAQLQPSAVTTGKIAKEAVKGGKLAKNAVTTDRLRDASVSASKLAKEAVGTAQLGKAAVTAEKLAAGAVGAEKLGTINARPTPNGIGAKSTELASSQCEKGEKLIGVGALWGPTGTLEHSIEAAYISNNVAYVRANNSGTAASTLTVQAICLG